MALGIERFSASFVVGSAVNPGAAYAELLSVAASAKSISIRSLSVTTTTAIGGTPALARSFAIGTGTVVQTGVSHRGLASGVQGSLYTNIAGRLTSAWSQAPTGFGAMLRKEILPTATGQQRQLWSPADPPLIVEPGQSVLLINHASGIDAGGMGVSVTWEEGPY